ncbi:hypothetical protein BC937DRAFT_86989 [Endogone sp. FLAS-F59071]|nr:hypothetical protein BC937DRAFT_86989 [Endogone sp. FLAS-F59071]|eukprot:RUS22782.1 hypothetical protein BC937DRAFT_86989 [Endogone sp. FLAS-F59071]
MTLHPSTDLQLVSSWCHGYVAADLMALCQIAEETARWRRYKIVDDDPKVNQADFEQAFARVRITNLRNQTTAEKVPPVLWSDVGGLAEVKNKLEESVIWIYKHADAYYRLGIKPSKGVLLYGPPGTGKTLLAKAVATESSANFLPISIPDLIKGEVGESEKAVVNMFRVATRCSPCVVFLDELEALFGRREASGSLGKKLISQLLLELDALDSAEQSVVILAATNHPEIIDPAILRPGRLDRLIYVPPPPVADRLAILRVLAQTMHFSPRASLDEVARRTEGYTGADLSAVARKAGLLALRRRDGTEESNRPLQTAQTRHKNLLAPSHFPCSNSRIPPPTPSLPPPPTPPQLLALQRPIVYNAKVAAEIAKQVYVKEGMAFPTGKQLAETRNAIESINLDGFKKLKLGDFAKGSVIAAEAFAFFLVGEMIGRRNLVGYNVPAVGKNAHH